MEYSFSQLKKMDVISVGDGKNLGRIYDVILLLPENKIKGFFVTGGKGFRLTRSDMLIPVSQIVKVGEDVILVRTQGKPDCDPHPRRDRGRDACKPFGACDDPCFHPDPRRDFGEYE